MTAAASAVLAVVMAGCGPAPTASPGRATAAASASPQASQPATIGSASPTGGASASGSGVAVAADPSLLTFVPTEVDGVAVTYDATTTAQIAADPALAPNAVGIAVGLAVVAASSASEELAIVNVVRLRDPSVGEDWFRSWRDTYDTAACGPAGGVVGHAQSTIGGRSVFIGSCAGGALTYHVRLVPRGLVVSVTAVGSRKLGEKLIAGIAPS